MTFLDIIKFIFAVIVGWCFLYLCCNYYICNILCINIDSAKTKKEKPILCPTSGCSVCGQGMHLNEGADGSLYNTVWRRKDTYMCHGCYDTYDLFKQK